MLKRHVACILVTTTALLSVSACSTTELRTAYPFSVYSSALVEAVKYAGALKNAGGLPGFKKDDHADVKMSAGYKSDNLSEPTFSFPIEVEITAVKDAEKESVYHYVFREEAFEASWKLVRAWKTDHNGTMLVADLLGMSAK